MTDTIPDTATLATARDWLRERIDNGQHCPCCTQFAKVYRRKVTSPMARVLIAMHAERVDGTDVFVNLPRLGLSRGDEAKARYWGLIEPMPDTVRDDGSTRTGWWRLTPYGRAFVRNQVKIPKYVRIYDGRCIGYADDDAEVSILDALGTRFNYSELMAGI
jgi:hypothetical protein